MAINVKLGSGAFMATVGRDERFSANAWATLYEHFDSTLEDDEVIDIDTLFNVYHEINMHTLIELYSDEHPDLKYLDYDERIEYAKTIDHVIQVRDIIDSGNPTETWLVPFNKIFVETLNPIYNIGKEDLDNDNNQ